MIRLFWRLPYSFPEFFLWCSPTSMQASEGLFFPSRVDKWPKSCFPVLRLEIRPEGSNTTDLKARRGKEWNKCGVFTQNMSYEILNHCQLVESHRVTILHPMWQRTSVLTMSFIFCTLMLWHLGLCWSWRSQFSQRCPIHRNSKQLTCEHGFQMQTNKSRAHSPSNTFHRLLKLCATMYLL